MNSNEGNVWSTKRLEVESRIESLRKFLEQTKNDVENGADLSHQNNTNKPRQNNEEGLSILKDALKMCEKLKKELNDDCATHGNLYPDILCHDNFNNC